MLMSQIYFTLIYIIKVLLPLGGLIIFNIIGLCLLENQSKSTLALLYFSIGSLLFLSLPIVGQSLFTMQETHPPLNSKSLQDFSAQAIVVLGAGLRGSSPEYPQQITLTENTLMRVRYAAILAKQTHLPILVSGGKGGRGVILGDRPTEAEVMASVLSNEYNQTPSWQETQSHNTAENAQYTQKILSQHGVRRIILVSHALHMRRAVEQFELQGFAVLPAPTVFLSHAEVTIFSFLPSIAGLSYSTMALNEWVGRVWYKIRYCN